jgi:hypothetical protein
MTASFAQTPAAAASALFADDFDDPIVEWSLDELDRSADLGSLRSAWTAADDLDD